MGEIRDKALEFAPLPAVESAPAKPSHFLLSGLESSRRKKFRSVSMLGSEVMSAFGTGTGTWIGFELQPRPVGRKTDVWVVRKTHSQPQVELGRVKWFSRWRQYAFFPADGTIFEPVCLRDIARYCEVETARHREASRRGTLVDS